MSFDIISAKSPKKALTGVFSPFKSCSTALITFSLKSLSLLGINSPDLFGVISTAPSSLITIPPEPPSLPMYVVKFPLIAIDAWLIAFAQHIFFDTKYLYPSSVFCSSDIAFIISFVISSSSFATIKPTFPSESIFDLYFTPATSINSFISDASLYVIPGYSINLSPYARNG